MKQYKVVELDHSSSVRVTSDKELKKLEADINKYAKEGWVLQQVLMDDRRYFIGIFCK